MTRSPNRIRNNDTSGISAIIPRQIMAQLKIGRNDTLQEKIV